MQVLAPGRDELVPGGQFKHPDKESAPVALLKVAGGHGLQTDDEAAASVSLKLPDGHLAQLSAPGIELKVPLAHGKQLTEPPDSTCEYPGSHKMGGKLTPL